MPGGRNPKGPELVEGIDGAPEAKRKLKVILETIAGSKPIAEACEELGIAEAMFHKLRTGWLEESVKLLEPKALGRPPKERMVEVDQLARLEEENARLQRELRASDLKADIARTMPHIVRRGEGTEKKTKD
jgi:transposase-like protein